MNGLAGEGPEEDPPGMGLNGEMQKDHLSILHPSKKARKSVTIAEERNEEHAIAPFSLPEISQKKVVSLTEAGAHNAVLSLRKAIQFNMQQREKYEHTAAAFMDSEVDLYEEIVQLKAFAADPLLYIILLEDGGVADLLQLLLHDNVDVAISVVSLFLEWLDVDLLQQEDEAVREAIIRMATAYLMDGAEVCWTKLARMQTPDDEMPHKEEEEEDDNVGRGSDDVKSLFILLLEMDLEGALQSAPPMKGCSVAKWLCQYTCIVPWIFTEWFLLASDKNDTRHNPRSVELLAYLTSREDVYDIPTQDWTRHPIECDAKKDDEKSVRTMDVLLNVVGAFRKRQPTTEAELELLENACTIVASLLTFSPPVVAAFLDDQGIELVLRCCKERVYAGALTLPWLDFSGADPVYRRACEYAVDVGALKLLFPFFLGRQYPKFHSVNGAALKSKKRKQEFHASIEATTIHILYAMVRHLRDDSPQDAKARVLAKFREIYEDQGPNEKVRRLVDRLLYYDQKARLAEYNFYRSDVEESLNDPSMIQLAALEAKLAGGGDLLHRLAAIAAFVCCGSQQVHAHVLAQLQAQQSGIGLIRTALEEFVSVLEDASDQKRLLLAYLDQI